MGTGVSSVCPCQNPSTDPKILDLLVKCFVTLDTRQTGFLNTEHLRRFGLGMDRTWGTAYLLEAMGRRGLVDPHAIDTEQFIHFVEHELPMDQGTASRLEIFLLSAHLQSERLALLNQVFERADCSDHRGVIDHDQFIAFGRFLNCELDAEKMSALLRQISVTGADEVTRDEFLRYFSKLSDPVHDEAFNRKIRTFLDCDVRTTKQGRLSIAI